MPIPTVQTPAKTPTPGAQAAPPAARYGPDRFDPVALVLAYVLPGLGHWYLGEKKRAGLIAAGILGLFVGGVFIGGIDAVDSKEDTIWFVGQALVGPVAFGTDYIHQNQLKVRDPASGILRSAAPDETRDASGAAVKAQAGQRPPSSKSLARMNELGTLFSTIAGMLNLLVIIDAAMHGRKQ